MPGETATSYKKLSNALGIGQGTAHAYVESGVLPARGPDGTWSLDECRRALAAHRRGEAPAVVTPAPSPPPAPAHPSPAVPAPPVSRNELLEEEQIKRLEGELGALASGALSDQDLDLVLRTSTDLLELASAGALKAARAYAGKPDEITAKTYQASLDVLRKAKNDDLDYRQKTGELIEREVAKAVIGEIDRGFVTACMLLKVRIRAQYELWHTDTALNARPVEERGQEIEKWVEAATDQARLAEIDEMRKVEVEKRVAAEIAARARAKRREVK